MSTLGKYVWRLLMTALLAVGLAGATAPLNLVKSHRLKDFERQWTQVHSSDLQSNLLAEQKRVQRNWFIGVAVGLFVLENLALTLVDRMSKKPEQPKNTETLESTNS
jgi:hypothetical protein